MKAEERNYFAENNHDGRLEFGTNVSRTFTVDELKFALSAYPGDTRVGVFGFDGGGAMIDLVYNDKDRRLGIIGDSS